jgi:hypothetical protein
LFMISQRQWRSSCARCRAALHPRGLRPSFSQRQGLRLGRSPTLRPSAPGGALRRPATPHPASRTSAGRGCCGTAATRVRPAPSHNLDV